MFTRILSLAVAAATVGGVVASCDHDDVSGRVAPVMVVTATADGHVPDLDGSQRLDIVGVDGPTCDDMGGAFVGEVCQGVDY
jgi:hypothetical protein